MAFLIISQIYIRCLGDCIEHIAIIKITSYDSRSIATCDTLVIGSVILFVTVNINHKTCIRKSQ